MNLRTESVEYRPTGQFRIVKKLCRLIDGTYRVTYRRNTEGRGKLQRRTFRFRDPAQHFYDDLPSAFRPSP